MRRKEKEITEKSEIEAIIHKATVCRIGLSDSHVPYIVPVCFGYHDSRIYIHGAMEGRKIDTLKKNPNVCVEFDINAEIVKSENACEWGVKYRSVIGFGTAAFIDDPAQKQKALNIIMEKYSGRSFSFPETAVHKTAVIEIRLTGITGKQSGF